MEPSVDPHMLRFAFYGLLTLFILGLIGVGAVVLTLYPDLPSTQAIKSVPLETPLRVYTREGKVIAEFGEKRRIPVTFADTPRTVINAFLAAEDDRFYTHPGVDWQAILRATLKLIQNRGEITQGGSTITMQVARLHYFTSERTYKRKINEILVALKIERELEKDEILELYINKIFLGHRAYGVGAAAWVYYGKQLADLSLAQAAMITGLPKAPSKINPVTNPTLALERRNYVLGRMLTQRYIDETQYQAALGAPVTAKLHGLDIEVDAPYVAEMVRQHMTGSYADQAYTGGFKVYTTVDARLQSKAVQALRKALIDYDRRHGYRGPEHHYELHAETTAENWSQLLDGLNSVGGLQPALVVAVAEQSATVYVAALGTRELPWCTLKWARRHISANRRGAVPKTAADVLAVGDVIRVQAVDPDSERAESCASAEVEDAALADEPTAPEEPIWLLGQLAQIEGALVSMRAEDGAIQSLVGGFDFSQSNFNRAIQARRQPGSNFKPFIYSAALETGMTAASFINDAPIVFDAPGLESIWRPENYSGKYYGPTRLREALAKSRNLVSIRLLRRIGIERTLSHAAQFGFDANSLPNNLSLSLGSGELAPIDIVRGYAVFANGGYLIDPHFIERIETGDRAVVFQNEPLRACQACEQAESDPADEPDSIEALQALVAHESEQHLAPRVLSAENAWIISSMLREVIRRGTGQRARRELQRADLGGKTGTTNEQRDAWFSGFNHDIVTTVWVGFDQLQPLGKNETGARAALPMWIDYMRAALDGTPASLLEQPPGLVTMRINKHTGQPAPATDPDAIMETFRSEYAPRQAITDIGPLIRERTPVPNNLPTEPFEPPEQLF